MRLGWLARNWFLVGLAVVAGLAFLVPEAGARGGPLRPEISTRAAVAAIFFLQGLVLAPAVLRAGAMRWRLHVTTQLFVFVWFPLALILLDALGGRLLAADLRLGFLFLAIVPTTISTCVVFTALARGNTTGALFNSAFANIAGVVVTPIWAAFLLRARGETLGLGSMILEITLLLLVPLALGQLVRPAVRRAWEPGARTISAISSTIILFIVFTAFASSVATGAFRQIGPFQTGAIALVATAVFLAMTAAAWLLGRLLGFRRDDRVAFLFCGPQKTLAAGAPMAQILFAGHPGIGLVLLPLILYHAVQLLGGAMLAKGMSTEE
jgi:solute carrier family 10 (sodium/bile acid cotransporter), member 7